MATSRQQPLDLDDRLGHARIRAGSPSAVRGSPFCCVHDVNSFDGARRASTHELSHSQADGDATPPSAALDGTSRESSTTTERRASAADTSPRTRRVVEEREIARHESTLPKHARIRQVPRRGESAARTDARARATRRRRPPPARNRIVACRGASRACLEPLRASDETEIEKRPLRRVRARTPPSTLAVRRACRRHRCEAGRVAPVARSSAPRCAHAAARRHDTENRSAISVAMRRMHHLQSRSPAKTGLDCAGRSTEQCRKFV